MATPQFKVGDRVRDIFGDKNRGVITDIDVNAGHGLGSITVKYDDGRILRTTVLGCGVEIICGK